MNFESMAIDSLGRKSGLAAEFLRDARHLQCPPLMLLDLLLCRIDDDDPSIYPFAGDTYGDGVDGDCDGLDCEAAREGDVYYALCAAEVSHAGAEALCEDAGYTGLAELRVESEYSTFLDLQAAGSPSHHYWFGLIDAGGWIWSSGYPLGYEAWYTGEPSGDGLCGLVWNACDDRGPAWNDLPCVRTTVTCASMGAACEYREE